MATEDKELLLVNKLMKTVKLARSFQDFEDAAVETAIKEMGLSETEAKKLAKRVVNLNAIQPFMDDEDVEDIMINDLDKVFIYSFKNGMVKTNAKFSSKEEFNLLVRKLLMLGGKEGLSEINDLHLPAGSRANIVESPLGPQITIRRFKQRPPSIIDLMEWQVLDSELAALLWLYSDGLSAKPANILFVGPPAAGKTTLLNALFSFYPPKQRTVVIEDTFELNTEMDENCSRLVTTEKTDMETLVKNSLRMRPDRLIIGEVRGREAKDMMTAMNLGKICAGTIHAESSREAMTRLQNEPMNVPVRLLTMIDAVVVLGRFRENGISMRRIVEIAEISGTEGNIALLSQLYAFDFQSKKTKKISPSVTYRDRLAATSGFTPKQIMDELEIRSRVLKQLQKRGVRMIEDVSAFCRDYHENPEKALNSLKDAKPVKAMGAMQK